MVLPSFPPRCRLITSSMTPRASSSPPLTRERGLRYLRPVCVFELVWKILWTINRSSIAQCSGSPLELRHHIRLVMLDAIGSGQPSLEDIAAYLTSWTYSSLPPHWLLVPPHLGIPSHLALRIVQYRKRHRWASVRRRSWSGLSRFHPDCFYII